MTSGVGTAAVLRALIAALVAGFWATACWAQNAPAVVEKLEVTARKPAFAGRTFGDVGPYELIAGVATVRVDPKNEANRPVVDLDKAADADGFVRFQTDVVVLRPVDAAKASRVLIVDIANRGNKLALMRMADGASQFDTATQAGNGWPMRQGHSFAWIGWQGDVPLGKEGHDVGTKFPVATNGGAPLTGRSVEEYIFDKPGDKNVVALTYPAASRDQAKATLTVQETPTSADKTLSADAWHYVDDTHVEITRAEGFDAGAIYHLTYEARDPKVMGLGLVALRDVGRFLRAGTDVNGIANPMAGIKADTAIVLGISQSGRFLRDFLWYGFNAAAEGGKVYDGAMVVIAGSRKSFVNARFAQPGRFSREHEDHYYYGDQFPFTYAVTTDPVSGHTDGIFARCEASKTCPKLMQLDSSLEFWQARASLVVADSKGKAVPIPDNVRLYLMAGTQHGPAVKPAQGICQQLNNPAAQAPAARALMAALIAWARDGKTPPASRYPMPGHGLVEGGQATIGFPDLSAMGVHFPKTYNALYVVDHDAVPPRVDTSKAYHLLFPRTDKDGSDLDGVRLPEVEVPLATYTGWGLRKVGFAEGELCSLNGMYLPLAKDAAARAAAKDPRPSISERYASKAAYLTKYRIAGEKLREDGFLLDEDLQRILVKAEKDTRLDALP